MGVKLSIGTIDDCISWCTSTSCTSTRCTSSKASCTSTCAEETNKEAGEENKERLLLGNLVIESSELLIFYAIRACHLDPPDLHLSTISPTNSLMLLICRDWICKHHVELV